MPTNDVVDLTQLDTSGESDADFIVMAASSRPASLTAAISPPDRYMETRFEVTPRASLKLGSNGPSPRSSRSFYDTTPTRSARLPLGHAVASNISFSTSHSMGTAVKPTPESTPNTSLLSSLSSMSTSRSQLTPKKETPKQTTPRRGDMTVEKLEESLRSFCFRDLRKSHGKLMHHTLRACAKQAAPQRRHLSSVADLGDLNLEAVEEGSPNTMRVKLKQHGREQARGKLEQKRYSYAVTCIKSDKERVPKYRFHHVDIAKNILTPNTMLKFVPHLRDLEKSEEEKYGRWIKELEAMDAQSGFKVKALDRSQKVAKTMHDETAAELSLYIERWVAKLGLDNCSKSTLIRYMASQAERDDKMTPQQKSSIINSYSEDAGSPRAVRAAKLFTEAFDRVFRNVGVTLRDVLLLDESVETIVDSKKWVKDGKVDNPGGEQLVEMVEQWLTSYTILGCLICYSHSCEHGEYDVENQKRTFSVDSIGKYGGLLKHRRTRQLLARSQNGLSPQHQHSSPCKNQCFRGYDIGNDHAVLKPWTDEETMLLRCLFTSLGEGNIKPSCAASVILNRRCWEVYRKLKELELTLPDLDAELEPPKAVRPVTWYDRNKKMLMGDWQDYTVSHEHARREINDPCRHDGPCTASNGCSCAQNDLLCERFCRCTAATCAIKFTGCACHSTGKTCLQRKQEGKPCICVQLNRECDPVLCTGCGARERADPENALDEALHSTGCQNVALQRGKSKVVVLGKSQLEGCGYGLFTAEDISQDEFIIEYKGELITHDEGVRREARRGDVFDEESSSSYLFTLLEQEGIWVDAAIYGNLSRYINHAGEHDKRGCNITPKILYVNGEFRIRFAALRDIRAGEELFFNYGENFPNLTQKLLDSKEADDNNSATGAAAPVKNKGGRPRRTDKPVARKTTSRRKGGGARKEAPEPEVTDPDPMDWDQDDDAAAAAVDDDPEDLYQPGRYNRKTGRKRKRRSTARAPAAGADDDDDEEEEEYRPEIGDSQEDLDSGVVSEPIRRPRGRPRGRPGRRPRRVSTIVEDSDSAPVPRGTNATTTTTTRRTAAAPHTPSRRGGRRGGRRQGQGQQRHRARHAYPDSDEPPMKGPAATAATTTTTGRKRKRVEDSEEEVEVGRFGDSARPELDLDDDDDDAEEEEEWGDDDDVVDRSRRKRQKPLRYRLD